MATSYSYQHKIQVVFILSQGNQLVRFIDGWQSAYPNFVNLY
jgi:hypothetical protein